MFSIWKWLGQYQDFEASLRRQLTLKNLELFFISKPSEIKGQMLLFCGKVVALYSPE
jgi:hypothetical protein